MYVLDDTDRALLAELQRDSRQTVQQLAAAVGLSATPCWKRVKEMEAAGVIRGYGASVDRESVGLSLCVLAEVNLTQHTENTVREFERAVAACPQIVSCYSTTGAADYSIKVLAADILVVATPTWMGQASSVCMRVLERLDAELSEQDDQGRPSVFGKVAVVAMQSSVPIIPHSNACRA